MRFIDVGKHDYVTPLTVGGGGVVMRSDVTCASAHVHSQPSSMEQRNHFRCHELSFTRYMGTNEHNKKILLKYLILFPSITVATGNKKIN